LTKHPVEGNLFLTQFHTSFPNNNILPSVGGNLMKEKNGSTADNSNKPSISHTREAEPPPPGQAVEAGRKGKVQKLCMEKYPDGPLSEEVETSEPDESSNADKKTGSHSLSELHHFQNNHK
jgi:hypothetical protein